MRSAVPEYLEQWFGGPDPQPLVIFAYHREVVSQLYPLCAGFGLRCVGIGDEALEKRQLAVDAFQQGHADVFIAPIRAAGVGLNLHRASDTLFIERDWTPSRMSQCEDRCIVEGQLVETSRGPTRIEEVRKGDMVLSHTGRWQRVLRTKKREHRGLMTAVTYYRYSDPLVCTHDHKLLVAKGGARPEWMPAHTVLPGDSLIMPRLEGGPGVTELEFPAALRHDPTQLSRGGNKMRNGRYVPMPETFPLDDELLFACGWYLAEGCSILGRGKGNSASFSGHRKEEPILERIGRRMELFGVKATIARKKMWLSSELRAYSVELARWFGDHFGNGAHDKHLPDWAWRLSRRQMRIVLDAYVQGDGYRRKRQTSWISVSVTLAHQMALLAAATGESPSLIRTEGGKNDGAWVGTYTVDGIPHNAKLCRSDEDYVYHPVRRVETYQAVRRPKTMVYDLEVEEDHSFVVGQAVVHNCHRIGQRRAVVATYLDAQSTVDEYIADVLTAKQKLIATAVDGYGAGDGPDAGSFDTVDAVVEKFTSGRSAPGTSSS
jgi:intein/homing endonuclease